MLRMRLDLSRMRWLEYQKMIRRRADNSLIGSVHLDRLDVLSQPRGRVCIH
jgi:hypothetical protein